MFTSLLRPIPIDRLRLLGARTWRDPVVRNSAGAMAVSIGGMSLGYLTQIFLARTLGPEGYGEYTYSTAWLNVAQMVGSIDIAGAALRFVALYAATGAWGLLRGFVWRARAIVAGASVTLTGLVILFILALGDRISPARTATLLVACAAVVPAAFLLSEANILQALHRTFGARVPGSLVRPLVLLTGIAVALGAGARLTSARTLALNALGLLVAALLSLWWVERVRPAESRRAPMQTRTGEWVRMSLIQLSASVLQLILSQQSDVIVAGSLLNSRAAGLYAVASQLAGLVLFGGGTVTELAAPRLAAFNGNLHSAAFEAEVRRVSYLNWALSLPLAAVFALAGPWILRTFGPGYAAAYPTFCVLLIPQVVGGLWGGLAGTLLAMVGYHRAAAVLIGVSAALNVGLTLVLTPRYGIVGTALATAIAITMRAVAMQVVIYRALGIWLLPGFGRRAAAPPAA